MFVVLRANQLLVFKDQRHYNHEPTRTYRNEGPADLNGASCSIPADYTKKKNVFRLKLANGAEYLFEAHDAVS